MKRLLTFVFLVLSYLSYCGRFQVFDLTPVELISFSLKEKIEGDSFVIPISVKENLVYFLPQTPTIMGSEILLPLPENNLIAYFPKITSEPEGIFTTKTSVNEVKKLFPKQPVYVLPEGIIGNSCIGNQYLVFQVFQTKDTSKSLEPEEPENRLPAVLYPETKEVNPYKLFFFSKDELKKNKDWVFVSITEKTLPDPLKLFCYSDFIGALLQKSEKEFYLLIYDITTKTLNEIILTLDFLKNQHKDKVLWWENVFLTESREVMGEVSIRDAKDLSPKHKEIYSVLDQKLIRKIENPQLSLLHIFPDKSYYLGLNEEDSLLIEIFDAQNSYIKNNKIEFQFEENYWRDFFINQEGRFFSSKLEEHQYSIIEWK
ncbi:MAG: hypothetical protein NZ853_02600 [Leptospiraceae bacterium]|nr:hypothetical protein [Leptospiraceae bacterium]MDW7975069.1 hypothetical protein [Leptospiraceae bacterium]